MLDTLKLNLEDFEVEPHAELDLSLPTINVGTGEVSPDYVLWKRDGRSFRGVKAFHNSEHVNITLKPRREAPGAGAMCIVQFSVPKVAGGGNYHTTDHKGTVQALEAVQKHLDAVGIKTNLQRASVGRLDAAQTLAMREPFEGYTPVLGRLRGKRAQRRDYGSTYLWGNTRWEACFYDKLEEMRRLKLNTAGLPVNSLRAEVRALKAAKVREMFGFRTVGELLDGLDHVREVYRSHMEAQLFKHELPDGSGLSRGDLVEQLEASRDASRYWFRTWLRAFALHQLAHDADALKYAVRQVAPDRMTAHRIIREIEQGEREALALQEVAPGKRTWGSLYEELREKVLA